MTKAAHYPGKPAPMPARVAAACAVVAALLAGCAADKPAQVRRPPPQQRDWAVVAPQDPATANAVVIRAIGLVGTPYRYGGNSPEGGFDCSGLVNYVFRDTLDVRLPRTSRELSEYQGDRIAPDRLAAADLVFFGSRGAVTHVGIYVGQGRFVHAPSTGGTVRLDHLDGAYWRERYTGSRRILR